MRSSWVERPMVFLSLLFLSSLTFESVHSTTTSKPLSRYKITGGGDAKPETPSTPEELADWLSDSKPRVILINRVFNFVPAYGNSTLKGCEPWPKCPNGNQVQAALNYNNWCHLEFTNPSPTQVTFNAAGVQPLYVNSHKTIIGDSNRGVLRGKGLKMFRSSNIIVKNIHITWINPQCVWCGDGIDMNGATDVWIDHCTFSYIGRQMVSIGNEPNTNIQLTNNDFQGITEWSPRCNNKHYWTVLLAGADDDITIADNCFDSTSGRSPKVGGVKGSKVNVHYYNNLHTNGKGELFEIAAGGTILAEGNVFKDSSIIDPGDIETRRGGQSFVPFTAQDESLCQSKLSRKCVKNLSIGGSPYRFGLELKALDAFKKNLNRISHAHVLSAEEIQKGPRGGCGFGLIR